MSEDEGAGNGPAPTLNVPDHSSPSAESQGPQGTQGTQPVANLSVARVITPDIPPSPVDHIASVSSSTRNSFSTTTPQRAPLPGSGNALPIAQTRSDIAASVSVVPPTEAAQSGANAAVAGADPGESTSASAAHGGAAGAPQATNSPAADADADIDDAEAEQEGEQEGGEEQDTPRMQMEGKLESDLGTDPDVANAKGKRAQRLSVSSVSSVNAVLVEAPAPVDPTVGVNGGEESTPPP